MMKKHNIKFLSGIVITLFSLQVFAEDSIRINVKTSERAAAAIGYTVGGKDSGGPGKSYTGLGPKNKKYVFGYRKDSIKGPNISCGALTLTKNSNVTLVTKGKKCRAINK